jgi:hypothetical protein
MPTEALRIQSTIADLAAISSDVEGVAALAASTWREIHSVLSSIIGPGGVAALYQRSLYVTRAAYPCLGAVREDALRSADFAALQVVLSQQTIEQAVAANAAVLQTFCDLLASLVGVPLTERLLRSVRNLPSGGPAVQESSR